MKINNYNYLIKLNLLAMAMVLAVFSIGCLSKAEAISEKTTAKMATESPVTEKATAPSTEKEAHLSIPRPEAKEDSSAATPSTEAESQPTVEEQNVIFILDSSGSMAKPMGSRSKLVVAKEVVGGFVKAIPNSVNLGFMAYGHRNKNCDDIELLNDLASDNRDSILTSINSLAPKGNTPISASILKAAEYLKDKSGKRTIVLVSDGEESCSTNPVETVKQLRDLGIQVTVHVVGFGVTDKEDKQLQAIANAGGGNYYSAKNADEFKSIIQEQLAEETISTPDVEPSPSTNLVNLALESNGGEVLAASYEGLTALVDGKVDNSVGAGGGEMVVGFKGGRSAIVEKVTWFIKGTSDYNVKEFEILVSNESPTSGFKSVGKFTTQNIKLLKTSHQEFNFTPVKARYIKWKALSRHDGYNDRNNLGNSDCYELQVFGKLLN